MSAAEYTKGPLETRPVPGMNIIAIAQVGKLPHASVYASSADHNTPLNAKAYADAALYAVAPEMFELLHCIWVNVPSDAWPQFGFNELEILAVINKARGIQ